jgi:uncharacterized membrane protein
MAGCRALADDRNLAGGRESRHWGVHMKRNAKKMPGPKSANTLTREDATNYLRRFPSQSTASVVMNIGMVLFGNAIVFWLLISGELRATHLIVLVAVETVLLIAISSLLQRLVPRSDWLEQPKQWRESAPVIVFVLVWLGGAYGFTLAMIQGYPDLLALGTLQTWIETRLYVPLLYTLGLAVLHGIGDLRHFRRKGGPFISEVSHDAMARYLTLILGAIPFAMPFFAVTIGGFKGVEYIFGKARTDPAKSLLAGGAMLAIVSLSFAVIELLISSEVNGWAIGFVFAKLIAEVLIVCIPLVMVQVVKESEPSPANAVR